MHKNKGFTLIELLVVVAIMAILTAIVITATSVSRGKGANAGVKSNLRTIMQQAELLYINANPTAYGTVSFGVGPCTQAVGTPFNDGVIWAAILEAQKQSGGTMPTCASTTSTYAVSAQLRLQEGVFVYWCIDSQSTAKGEASNITGPVCN